MSVQTALRPSALPLPKTISTGSLGGSTKSGPVFDPRSRRAGSTPTRTTASAASSLLKTATSAAASRKASVSSCDGKVGTATKSVIETNKARTAVIVGSTNIPRSASTKRTTTGTGSASAAASKASAESKDTKAAKQPVKTRRNVSKQRENNNNNNSSVNNNQNTGKTKDFVKNNAAAVRKNSTTVSRKTSTNRGTAKENNATTALKNTINQPDLVKISSKANVANVEVARLEAVVASKTRENDALKSRLKHSARGFEAFAVTIKHEAEAVENLRAKIGNLQVQLEQSTEENERMRGVISEHEAQKENEAKEGENHEQSIGELTQKLRQAQEHHEAFVIKLRNDHKSEMDLQADSHRIAVQTLENQHESVLKDRDERHNDIIREAEDSWKQKLAKHLEDKADEVERLNSDWERQSEKWTETRRSLETQLTALQTELREQEMATSAKAKGDMIMKSTQNKLSKVMAEVDSLKVVLEMKNEEIHKLRLEKALLEEKIEDFDKMRLAFNKANAQMEDLKAQLNEKNMLERKLSEENRQLYTSVERELNEKRRLTMEKEELEWRMKSFSEAGAMSMSMMEGAPASSPFDSLTSATPMHMSLQAHHYAAAPASGECPQSLPSFRGRKCRPVSAPPGKLEFGAMISSTPNNKSSRILEVVEKNESVAWKIEYNPDEQQQQHHRERQNSHNSDSGSVGCSPRLRRKASASPSSTPRSRSKSGSRTGSESAAAMSRSYNRTFSVPKEHEPLMVRSCVGVPSVSRSDSVKKKIIPSFEPLSESTESDSLEDALKDEPEVKKETSPSVNIVARDEDLDMDDIGDISSSSEIEIDEPLAEVTTPQIEALMFPDKKTAAASSDSGATSGAEAASPDGEVTIKADLMARSLTDNKMSTSIKGDLNKMFPAGVQDSGGEAMVAEDMEMDLNVISENSEDGATTASKPDSEAISNN